MWVINDCEGKVIYDVTIKTAPGHEPLTAEQQKDMAEFIDSKLAEKEEANMDKPRICEVLGVEMDEEFTIGENQYFIDKSGDMWCVTKNGEKLKCGTAICCAINHPERIIRKTRFTQQEVEDAKTLKRLFGEYKIADFGARHVFGGLRLNEDAFPSIQQGQSYTLDEIIGGAG